MSTHISIPWSQDSAPAPSRVSLALRQLPMPLLALAFATYLTVSMVGMEVSESVDFPGPRFFPAIIAAGIFILGILDTVRVVLSLRQPKAGYRLQNTATYRDGDPAGAADEDAAARLDMRSLVWCLVGFVLFIVLLEILGWILGAALLFWCVARGFGATRHVHSAVVGLTLSSATYLAFSAGLGLPLPAGFLGGVL